MRTLGVYVGNQLGEQSQYSLDRGRHATWRLLSRFVTSTIRTTYREFELSLSFSAALFCSFARKVLEIAETKGVSLPPWLARRPLSFSFLFLCLSVSLSFSLSLSRSLSLSLSFYVSVSLSLSRPASFPWSWGRRGVRC